MHHCVFLSPEDQWTCKFSKMFFFATNITDDIAGFAATCVWYFLPTKPTDSDIFPFLFLKVLSSSWLVVVLSIVEYGTCSNGISVRGESIVFQEVHFFASSNDWSVETTLARFISFWITDDCSFSNCVCNVITNFMASCSPILSNQQSFTFFLNLVIQWSWVSSLLIGLVQKNPNLSAVKFFFNVKCVIKMFLAALYESTGGVTVENSSPSFWLLIMRKTAIFDRPLSLSVAPSKVAQNSKCVFGDAYF